MAYLKPGWLTAKKVNPKRWRSTGCLRDGDQLFAAVGCDAFGGAEEMPFDGAIFLFR
jgi:hypothetical protein